MCNGLLQHYEWKTCKHGTFMLQKYSTFPGVLFGGWTQILYTFRSHMANLDAGIWPLCIMLFCRTIASPSTNAALAFFVRLYLNPNSLDTPDNNKVHCNMHWGNGTWLEFWYTIQYEPRALSITLSVHPLPELLPYAKLACFILFCVFFLSRSLVFAGSMA